MLYKIIKRLSLLFISLLISCSEGEWEPAITFDETNLGTKIDLSKKLGDKFSIIRDSLKVDYHIIFNKNSKKNLIVKNDIDTIFHGLATKRKELYLLSRLNDDSSHIVHALQITDSSIIGLETEILQSYLLKEELTNNPKFSKIKLDTSQNKVSTTKRDNKNLFRAIIHKLPNELFYIENRNNGLRNENDTIQPTNITFSTIAYPNPFTNSLTVKSDVFSTYDIRIVNESTEVFYDTQFKGDKHHITTSNFPKGTYFLFIKGGVTDKKIRLIKE